MRQVASDRKKFKISRIAWWVVSGKHSSGQAGRPLRLGYRGLLPPHVLCVETPLLAL